MIILDKSELFDEIRKLRTLLLETLPRLDGVANDPTRFDAATADELAARIRKALEVEWP